MCVHNWIYVQSNMLDCLCVEMRRTYTFIICTVSYLPSYTSVHIVLGTLNWAKLGTLTKHCTTSIPVTMQIMQPLTCDHRFSKQNFFSALCLPLMNSAGSRDTEGKKRGRERESESERERACISICYSIHMLWSYNIPFPDFSRQVSLSTSKVE